MTHTKGQGTKRPWYKALKTNGVCPIFGHDNQGNSSMPVFILDNYSKEKDIDFMINAVNCHDELVEALKVALGFIKLEHLTARGGTIGSTISIIKQALSKAEKEC